MTDTVAQDYFNVAWPLALEASKACGVHAEIIFAQSALETGYGLHAPQHNYFGIKGSGQNLTTVEVINGVAETIKQHFAGFPSMASSFQGYAKFILRNRRYKRFRSEGSISSELVALGTSGYATDPNYSMKIGKIVDLVPQYLAASPFAITPIPQMRITAKSLGNVSETPTEDKTMGNPTVKPPHQTGLLADLGHEFDTLFNPVKTLAGELTAHKTGLQVAVALATSLLPFAPMPAAASTAVVDILDGLSGLANKPIPAVPATTDPTTGAVIPAQPEKPAPAEPLQVAAVPVPDGVAMAIADGESFLSTLFTDFTTGQLNTTNVVKQAEAEAAVAIGQVEKIFNPGLGIVNDPTKN